MSEALAHLPILLLAAALCWSLISSVHALLAVRAKNRARRLLSQEAVRNYRLRAYAERAARARFREQDTIMAIKLIEAAMRDLSETDRGLVERGLRQSSAAGTRRFVRDLLVTH